MIGQTVSHYRILEKLGGGGMGVVYKAEDTKLERSVALKFLPPDLTRDENAKKRFVREAKAASALQHNNICTIHEIDETNDGQLFLCMDYYDGETLRDKIAEGSVAVDEALDIAIQVAEGLSKAHERGIVHRDIKPANIMVTADGVVKILDFGLAKLAGQTKVTKTGITVGTISYMSPEQARGDDLDARSDVFSLGSVLYELLGGTPPFKGDHVAAVLYGIMNNHPEPLTKYRSDIPGDAERIVEGALQKEVCNRYRNAAEMATDLRRLRQGDSATVGVNRGSHARRRHLTIAAASISIVLAILGYLVYSRFVPQAPDGGPRVRHMIAVLPFENLGPAEDEYFADGVTEEITARLVGVGEIGVIARASVMQYKNTDAPVRQIGEELGVDYVVEGTIRWQHASDEPSRVRVTPQLVRVSDATHVWAEVYDETITEVFEVQTNIASRVVRAMGVALFGNEREALETVPTRNFEAYTNYLRAKDVARGYSPSSLSLAQQLLENATAQDSGFAIAYAELASIHATHVWYGYDRSEGRVVQARGAAEMALQLAPELPEAHMAMGKYFYMCLFDLDRAQVEFEIVLKHQPNNADALTWTSWAQRRKGKWEESLQNSIRAVNLNPLATGWLADLGATYSNLRRYSEAERYYDRAILLAPEDPLPTACKVWDAISQERLDHAKEVLRLGLERIDEEALLEEVMFVELFDGQYGELLRRLSSVDSELVFKTSPSIMPTVHFAAEIYEVMGQIETARSCYDSSRVLLERKFVETEPRSRARLRSLLGIANAGLGRKDEAIAEGRAAVELLPISKDALEGPLRVWDLARIYMMVGEFEDAMDQLEYVLSIPGLSVGWLTLDPRWTPLRDHPRFVALSEKHAIE